MTQQVRAAALTHFVEVAQSRGLSPLTLLQEAGLDPMVLEHPDLPVPVDRVSLLLERCARLSACEDFGLRMAARRQISNLGPVGLLIRDQPTLRDALNVLLRHQRAVNKALLISMQETGAVAIVKLDLLAGHGGPVRQAIELSVGVLMRLMSQILGAQWRPRRVCFMHDIPADVSGHLAIFGPCVEFRHDFNGIVCSQQDLDCTNPLADPAMMRYSRELLQQVLREDGGEAPFLDQVRQAILDLLPGGRCSIELMAQRLGLNCRTVQRRLADKGVCFSELVQELRLELAQRHVQGGVRPLSEVASLLGFSAASGFTRWYVGQFGHSPSQARVAASR